MRNAGFGSRGKGLVTIMGLSEADVEESSKMREELGGAVFRHECYCDDIKNGSELRGEALFVKPGSFCWTEC